MTVYHGSTLFTPFSYFWTILIYLGKSFLFLFQYTIYTFLMIVDVKFVRRKLIQLCSVDLVFKLVVAMYKYVFACSADYPISKKTYLWNYTRYNFVLDYTQYKLHKDQRGEITVMLCHIKAICLKLYRILFSRWIQSIWLNPATLWFHPIRCKYRIYILNNMY